MGQLVRDLRKWFFVTGQADGAAALRIAFCALYLFMLWDFLPNLDLLFGHRGLFGTQEPTYLDTATSWKYLLFRHDSPVQLRIWFWASVAVTGLAMIGALTRVTVVLMFASLVLFQERDPFMVYGADVVMRCVGLWLLFLDSGRVLSVDRLWRRARGGGRANPQTTIPLWPMRAIQVQVALIYLIAFGYKIRCESWIDGSAVYYALHLRDLNPQLIADPGRWRGAMILFDYGTLAVEGMLPLMLFYRPLRMWGLLAGVAMHTGIDVFMSIRFFSFSMYCAYLAFIDPEKIAEAVNAISRAWGWLVAGGRGVRPPTSPFPTKADSDA